VVGWGGGGGGSGSPATWLLNYRPRSSLNCRATSPTLGAGGRPPLLLISALVKIQSTQLFIVT
jgi:hypothetical protein